MPYALPMAEPTSELERAIRGPVPPALAALDAADRQALAAAVEAALEQQRHALAAAVDSGLGFVPRVLRGTVKRVVFR